MSKKKENYIKTGDHPIIDEWVNNVWPNSAKEAIRKYIPDYRHIVKFRTSMDKPTISGPLEDTFRLIINYNCYKDCFIVWDATKQKNIHRGKKMRLPIGKEGETLLRKPIDPDTMEVFYRKFRSNGVESSEQILIVGKDALADFCKDYMKYIKPDETEIPKGECCLYAVADGEIEYIQSTRDIE